MFSKIYKTSIVGESWVNLGVNFLLMLFRSKEKQGVGRRNEHDNSLVCSEDLQYILIATSQRWRISEYISHCMSTDQVERDYK